MSENYAAMPGEHDVEGCEACGKRAGVLSLHRDKFLCGPCWDTAVEATVSEWAANPEGQAYHAKLDAAYSSKDATPPSITKNEETT